MIARLAILDSYKVRWSRETVARDVVQNFFDEVKDFRRVKIEVDKKHRTVEIAGPSCFHFDYLRYLGATTKAAPTRRAAGSFGEGFKICALVLLRDYGAQIVAGSGDWELVPFLDPMKLGRELCYEIRRLERPRPGSFVRLSNTDPALRRAFSVSRELFRHPQNPRLSRPIYENRRAGVGVYRAQDEHRADLFYRRQHRGYLRFSRGNGLSFAYDDRIEKLEHDRDRRDIEAGALVVAEVARRLPDKQVLELIRRLRVYWAGGNRILQVVLSEARSRGLRMEFPRRWLARTQGSYRLSRYAERIGFHLGLPQLAALGMPAVTERLGKAEEPRAPTPREAARLEVARELYVHLAEEPPHQKIVKVTDIIGDDYASLSRWNAKPVVPARALAGKFADGIAPCLAAFAVESGLGSRKNADRLTAILDGAIRRAGTVRRFERRWDRPRSRSGKGDALILVPPGEPLPKSLGLWFLIEVLAPDGFPPADDLVLRLEAMCERLETEPRVVRVSVNSPKDAAKEFARGVPSIWIGGMELEPRSRAVAAFEVRTFGPEGALLPDEQSLEGFLRAGAARLLKLPPRRRFSFDRRKEGGRALDSYLAAHAPEEWRHLRIDRALNKVPTGDGVSEEPWYWPLHDLVYSLARRTIAGEPWELSSLDDRARLALLAATAEVRGFFDSLKLVLPGVATARVEDEDQDEDDDEGKDLLKRIGDRAARAVKRGVPFEEVAQDGVQIAPRFAEVAKLSKGLPLDVTCIKISLDVAIHAFETAFDRNPGTALAAARRAHREAVRRAEAFHAGLDEGAHVWCWDLQKHVRDLLPEGADPEERKEQIAGRVRRAWEEALAAGLLPGEAAGRALDAAALEDSRPLE
ncbi:MAG: hypothetical protein HY720_21055 [Planctomycetes bacterium]|nr:hypothetical protein [Planctomycetota bacterium]